MSLITISDSALNEILALRSQEEEADGLALGLRIVGVSPQGFTYETAFVRLSQLNGDHVEHHGDLPVAIPEDSVESLTGATVDMSDDPSMPGLVLKNPNSPSPDLYQEDVELTGTPEEKITTLLNAQINPAIASHGGFARLESYEDGVAYLFMGGGCQGCGLAAVTLREGIERAIKEKIPEVSQVLDVTDHTAGANPYYS
ncbi:MAG: NifU family protein [Acidimicrobiia bacterium]|nr:NifU family protein [Acidimicrobiia bacterium]